MKSFSVPSLYCFAFHFNASFGRFLLLTHPKHKSLFKEFPVPPLRQLRDARGCSVAQPDRIRQDGLSERKSFLTMRGIKHCEKDKEEKS